MKTVTIVSVHYDEERNHVEVVKEIQEDDGSTGFMLHVFPAGAIEQRAAEYGTNSFDEALQIILWEPHLDGFNPLEVPADQALMQRLPQAQNASALLAKPKRSGVKASMQAAGVAQHFIDNADMDHVEFLRGKVKFDEADVLAKRVTVEAQRLQYQALQTYKKGAQQVREALAQEVARAQARKQLFRQENMRREDS